MKAVLLSAGLGTRLKPLTNKLPKVMVPINGKPGLEYVIKNLKSQGIEDFLINTHHFPEKIVNYFKAGSGFGIKVNYSYEQEILGTAGALNNFKDYLKERFLVVYADVISNIQFKEALKIHKKNKAEATIILDSQRSQKGKGVVLTEGNRVIDFVEKSPTLIPGAKINSGFYILEPEILKRIPKGFSDFGKDILPALAKEEKVFCAEHKGYIFDIGTKKDLGKVESFFKD